MSSISYSLSSVTLISDSGLLACPGRGSLAAFLSLSSEKTRYICIDLSKATLYEFLTCFMILYKPAI